MSDRAERTTALQARLEEARAVLLRSLEGLTERDFAAPLPAGDAGDGESVLEALAALIAAERAAIAGGRGERHPEAEPAKPIPPQLTHGLAGAHYEAQKMVNEALEHRPHDVARVVEFIASGEEALAARIEALRA